MVTGVPKCEHLHDVMGEKYCTVRRRKGCVDNKVPGADERVALNGTGQRLLAVSVENQLSLDKICLRRPSSEYHTPSKLQIVGTMITAWTISLRDKQSGTTRTRCHCGTDLLLRNLIQIIHWSQALM